MKSGAGREPIGAPRQAQQSYAAVPLRRNFVPSLFMSCRRRGRGASILPLKYN